MALEEFAGEKPDVCVPPEVKARLATLADRMAPLAFRALDEAREFGGTYVALTLHRPGSGERVRLMVCSDDVLIEE